MKKHLKHNCHAVSDKDFIFDIFSNKGFVPNASIYLQADQSNEFNSENGSESDATIPNDAD